MSRIVVAVSLLVSFVHGQIRVVGPRKVKALLGNDGKIRGATATFGAPFYGSRIFGRLIYGESKKGKAHCTDEDYTLDAPYDGLPKNKGEGQREHGNLIDIAIVHRGTCSFVTKVRVAEAKGAHAVIFVDGEGATAKEEEISQLIIADDGYGSGVHIPSILISRAQGETLIEAAKSALLVAELKWEIPQNHIVEIDLWMSSGSPSSLNFLKEFAPNRKKLDKVVRFHPHYAVFAMPSADPAVFNDLCTDTTGGFCAEDPDGSGGITGKAILEEDVRQLCIHELYIVNQIHKDTEANDHVVAYAGKFWDYVEKLGDQCPGATDKTANPQNVFGRECSERLMKTVGIDVLKVQECQMSTQNDKLRAERENKAWSPSAVRINGWRYKGVLDADLVTRAICQGFITKPKECNDVLQKRDPFEAYTGAPPQRGMSLSTFLTLVSVGVCVMVCALFLYRRMLKKHVERTIREEVTLEVNTHMASYSKMAAQF